MPVIAARLPLDGPSAPRIPGNWERLLEGPVSTETLVMRLAALRTWTDHLTEFSREPADLEWVSGVDGGTP